MTSEERYEIRTKIGEGGVGSVYSAFDKHLNRDVAIKRVLPEGGYDNEDEATQAMLNEANALSSIQHPNIVTVYDSGVDKDGPYVVMELISGRNIDEMIERSTLTEKDFREVAQQTQEALIAAQDLNLLHRDIKPTNIMVSWLPSGRFQIKIVDFGLAKFSATPSLQTIDHGDAVLGSIHFMAPEQFERAKLDQRTDMYSIGCVYYFCLTGKYPFQGSSPAEVMISHLNGDVVPLNELRPDLPPSLCQWVMWHINRQMDDRPNNAREALTTYFTTENNLDAITTPLYVPPNGGTAPQPISPPEGANIPIQTTAQEVRAAQLNAAAAQGTGPQLITAANSGTAPVPTITTPIPVPVPGTSAVTAHTTATSAVGTQPVAVQGYSPQDTQPQVVLPSERGKKKTLKIVAIAILAVALIGGILLYMGSAGANKRIKRLNELAELGAKGKAFDFTKDDVEELLSAVATPGQTTKGARAGYLEALRLGKANDGSNIGAIISKYAKDVSMTSEVRKNLFQVLKFRKEESSLPDLIAFASETSSSSEAEAALAACAGMAKPSNFTDLLSIISLSDDTTIKGSARKVLSQVIKESGSPRAFASDIYEVYSNASNDSTKTTLARLMGSAGGDRAADTLQDLLSEGNSSEKVAAVFGLRDWPDDSQFEFLLEFTELEKDRSIRSKSFKACAEFLTDGPEIDDDKSTTYWNSLAEIATLPTEQQLVVNAMFNQSEVWAVIILNHIAPKAANERIENSVEKAIVNVEKNMAAANGG